MIPAHFPRGRAPPVRELEVSSCHVSKIAVCFIGPEAAAAHPTSPLHQFRVCARRFLSLGHTMPAISLAGNFKKATRSYIVGLDGSETSFRAIQTAAQVMTDLHDNLIIVSLGRSDKDKQVFEMCKNRAQDVAMKNHCPLMRIYLQYVQIPDSMNLDKAIINLANTHANGSSVLVIGAAGKGDEAKSGIRPAGQYAMGSFATSCVETCKVPVILVKSGGKLELDMPRVKRQGRDTTPGLNMMVSMDASPVSQRAFDLGLKMLTRLDTLFVYHVTDGKSERRAHMLNEMSLACDKLMDGRMCAQASLIEEPKTKTIKDHIEDFIEVRIPALHASLSLPALLSPLWVLCPCNTLSSRSLSPTCACFPAEVSADISAAPLLRCS